MISRDSRKSNACCRRGVVRLFVDPRHFERAITAAPASKPSDLRVKEMLERYVAAVDYAGANLEWSDAGYCGERRGNAQPVTARPLAAPLGQRTAGPPIPSSCACRPRQSHWYPVDWMRCRSSTGLLFWSPKPTSPSWRTSRLCSPVSCSAKSCDRGCCRSSGRESSLISTPSPTWARERRAQARAGRSLAVSRWCSP